MPSAWRRNEQRGIAMKFVRRSVARLMALLACLAFWRRRERVRLLLELRTLLALRDYADGQAYRAGDGEERLRWLKTAQQCRSTIIQIQQQLRPSA
jgi:hypothetical protein